MKKITFILGVVGMLFAGYMSAVKFLSDTCAFDKPCPYFWGLPACYYGLAMFATIVLCFILDYWKIIRETTAQKAVLAVSALGILFSGYFTAGELPVLFAKGFNAYFFGLPTCAIGLIFYIGIFALTLYSTLRRKTLVNPE